MERELQSKCEYFREMSLAISTFGVGKLAEGACNPPGSSSADFKTADRRPVEKDNATA